MRGRHHGKQMGLGIDSEKKILPLPLGISIVNFFFPFGLDWVFATAAHHVQFHHLTWRQQLSSLHWFISFSFHHAVTIQQAVQVLACCNFEYKFEFSLSVLFWIEISGRLSPFVGRYIILYQHQWCYWQCRMWYSSAHLTSSIINRCWLVCLSIVIPVGFGWRTNRLTKANVWTAWCCHCNGTHPGLTTICCVIQPMNIKNIHKYCMFALKALNNNIVNVGVVLLQRLGRLIAFQIGKQSVACYHSCIVL